MIDSIVTSNGISNMTSLPDFECASCGVLWDSSADNFCWICKKIGATRQRRETVENKADETIARLRYLSRI